MIRLTRAAAACVLALAVAAPALACMQPPHVQDFRKHPAALYTGAKATVDFSSNAVAAALSDTDKEKVKKAVEAGPNFAGAYRIVYVPCGEKCNTMLMVSLESGKIVTLPAEKNAFANFRANSRFLVVRNQGGEGVRYYVFDGREFQPTEAAKADSGS
jgi:hypothetical protein